MGVLEDEVGPQHQPHVAHDVDHERLDPCARGGAAPVPEGDQQIRGRAHERPAHDQQQEVAGQHQQQHREDEEVEVGEVARVAAVGVHVGDRVQVDERRHAADHQQHEHRQRIHEDRNARVDAGRDGVAPQRGGQRAMCRGAVLELQQRPQRGDEGEPDRARVDPSGAASRQRAVPQRQHQGAGQGEGQHEPGRGGRAQPCSSRSSSTSTGRRRR